MSAVPAAKPAKRPRSFRREFVTPEGVDLHLQLGTASDRGIALLIDFAIIGGSLIVLTLLVLGALVGLGRAARSAGEGVMVVWLVGAFVLRSFYFTAFELRPGAATPGKRAMGLRVVSRSGGRLTADAVFVRNAMREIELFLPLSFMMSSQAGGWLGGFGSLWVLGFLVAPLFNRDRLRAGDLVAGTMVISIRRSRLQRELAAPALEEVRGAVFTSAQLDAYGIEELQLLEQVLRRGDPKTLAAVAAKIRGRTGWSGEAVGDRAFLTAYYAGLRGRLEQRLLFGRRRANKHDPA